MTNSDRSASPPSRLLRAFDALNTRAWKLPPGVPYTVTRAVPISMRDGVQLLADVYTPTGRMRGTLLLRNPYGRSDLLASSFVTPYAARGYRVILQSTRGTFGSGGGPFEPMALEIEDGADTVAWLRTQPWFDGTFATIGASYLGFTQWALLMNPPPELKTAIVQIGVHDVYHSVHGSGAFRLDLMLSWFDSISRQERGGTIQLLLDRITAKRRLQGAFDSAPLLPAGEQQLGGGPFASAYANFLTRTDESDPYWAPRRLGDALERVNVPVLLIGGWQDIFLDQTLAQYARLYERDVDVALTVGPWAHGEGSDVMTRESLDWLAEHLGGAPRRRDAPVRVFVTGAKAWRDLPSWPPPTMPRTLYLQAGGRLGGDAPPTAAAPSTFTYDPAAPTPTIGGQLLMNGGYRDVSALCARADVLTFTSAVLTEPLDVMGVPEVELAHRSDNPHADVFVRLVEVDAKGRLRNLSDGFRRLGDADRVPSVHVRLDAVAHRFSVGSRVGLLISGGSHPQYARNLGTGLDAAMSAHMTTSRRVVAHGEGGVSRLTLPVTS